LRLLEQPAAIRVLSIFPEGPPLRFEWDRAYVVAHFWGPERIATGWWRSPHVQRDYYRVETEEGRRFWLFRETQTGDWHLHGVFD
jgi:protein ImuB